MRRTRRCAASRAPIREESDSSSSDDDQPLSKKINRNWKKSQEASDKTETKNSPTNKVQKPNSDDSSSESDIETYLQPISKLDLNSSFFDPVTTANKIQSAALPSNHKRQQIDSSSSDSDDSSAGIANTKFQTTTVPETEQKKSLDSEPVAGISRLNFQQLHDYTKKLEDTKKHVDEYNARQKLAATSTNSDIFNMLISGENKQTVSSGLVQKSQTTAEKLSLEDLHSSDFESCSSDDENDKDKWEVVKDPQKSSKDVAKVPKEGLQITVEMPGVIKKQKKRGQNELLMAIQRRLNKIKKENQILIHKVHLLCWLAHGNHVNRVLNSQVILATALSLLPSEKCYPEGRTDLKYLQQILTWFRNTMRNSDKSLDKNNSVDLATLLQIQMKNKEAWDKKMWVLIFIAVLRALGIQCRLVLSLQVEPLRPPQTELCSLKTTKNGDAKSQTNKSGRKQASQADLAKKPSKTSSKLNDSKAKSAHTKKARPPEKVVTALGKNTAETNKVPSSIPKNDAKSTRLRSAETMATTNKEVPKQPTKRRAVKAADEIPSKSQQPAKKPKIADSKSTEPSIESNKSKTTRQSSRIATNETQNCSNKTSQNRAKKAKVPQIDGLVDSQSSDSDSEVQTSHLDETEDFQSSDSETEEQPFLDFHLLKTTQDICKEARVPQLDLHPINSGGEVRFSHEVHFPPQLDGPTDSPRRVSARPKSKLNLKKLKPNEEEKKREPSALEEVPSKQRRSAASVPKYKDTDSSDDDFSSTPRSPFVRKSSLNNNSPVVNLKKLRLNADKKSEFLKSGSKVALDVRNDIVQLVKNRIKEQKHLDSKKLVQKHKKHGKSQIEDDDSDYAPEPLFLKKKHDSDDDFVPKTSRKSGKKKSQNDDRRLISSDSDGGGGSPKKKMGNDVWAEVFLETEEKWISVDLVSGKIHCVNELYKKATHPMVYVLAWNNNNTIRDVSPRYCQNFNTVTRKLRVNNEWWGETLKPFVSQKKTVRDLEEDDEFERQQLEKPLPTSIAEYKDHPLYVLKRHLLKFQAIYPPDPPPLGYVRKEAVYSRQCVYTLHSRDIWLKHAKVVKPGEKPYKIVKARPKYDRLSNTFITDQLLEVFGPWQTQEYEPPTAENGVVPRNAFGNVELFKPCMLPKKCVHLQLPGLNKIARRMNIDCASAIVGFDFHSGWSHPTYDGFVVCEEFADQLIAAWELEQEDMEKKEQEKIEKRVYGNWRKLIKGLLIRERLKAKYDFGGGEPSTSGSGGAGGKPKNKKGAAKVSTKKRRIYSDSGSASESDEN